MAKEPKCQLCTNTKDLKIDVFVWLTLGETSGFKTNAFTICGKCSGELLWALKSYLDEKFRLKKS